jgi:hypothetical protein
MMDERGKWREINSGIFSGDLIFGYSLFVIDKK